MVDEDFPGDEEEFSDAHPEAPRGKPRKTADAFRTISEVADELHVPQHVLRFWETKFPQVRPLKRGGGRRYYRPEDVLLLRRVADLLYTQGYTIKGVQRLLREGGGALHEHIPPASEEERQAAEAERHSGVTEAAPKKIFTPPQPAMPGLLPEPEPEHNIEAQRPAPSRAAGRHKVEQENERLRSLLAETLQALEELRRMIG
ncbi:MerR family transcriptional regulator [Acidocella sp.]|jgi:DNA-binding transcriptional MerR regulator|uniref:MerR family transcriptional regulator n=1 Tax=Acidocella sp. TaxID=50710 RepID=UPI002F42C492